MECASSLFAGDISFDASAIRPGLRGAMWSSCRVCGSRALAAGQAHFDVRMVEPTVILGRLVDGEPLPQATHFLAGALHQCLTARADSKCPIPDERSVPVDSGALYCRGVVLSPNVYDFQSASRDRSLELLANRLKAECLTGYSLRTNIR